MGGVIWTHWYHYGTCRGFAESQLLSLDASRFRHICSSFTSDQTVRYGELFVDFLNKNPSLVSDVGSKTPMLSMMIDEAFPKLDADDSSSDDGESCGDHVHSHGSLRCQSSPTPKTVQQRVLSF